MATAYGTLSTSNAANATITENWNRQSLSIHNLDASIIIYANFGAAAVAEQHIPIRGGQVVTLTSFNNPEIGKQLNLIAASGTPKFVANDNL